MNSQKKRETEEITEPGLVGVEMATENVATQIRRPFIDLCTREPKVIRNGVLDYIAEGTEDYCSNFGDQWNRFRAIQIDSLSGKSESRQRFLAETGYSPEELKDKVVLDAGCGAGRFAEVALELGAYVVAVDLSTAAYACRRTLDRFPPDRYMVVRADLRALPFRERAFDGVYSLGVLHHTPDPLATLKALTQFVAPGGKLAVWLYEKHVPDIDWVFPRTWIRRAIQHWPPSRKLSLSRALVGSFFPLGWLLSWVGQPGERLSRFLPYATRHHLGRGELRRQWDYSVMDTFDWYGPKFDLPQTEGDVRDAMLNAGLANVERLPARGLAMVGIKSLAGGNLASD